MNSFQVDLDFANIMRQRLDRHFYPAVSREGRFVPIARSAGSIYIQRHCHVDCIVASRKRLGGSVTIEEKIVRWPGREYTALTIETHSNLGRSPEAVIGDGWIATSTADYLLYAFQLHDGKLKVNVFNLPALREWFCHRAGNFTLADTPNEHYTTRCRVVPLDKIDRASFVITGKIV